MSEFSTSSALNSPETTASRRRDGELPTGASEPLIAGEDLLLSPEEEADVLSELDEQIDTEEMAELQDLLMGEERNSLDRLEGAVNGFISSMIHDSKLRNLVEAIVRQAIARRVGELHEEMDVEASRLVVNAFRRELAIKKADLPEMVAPFLGAAVSDAIDRASDRIREDAGRNIRSAIARELAVQRGRLDEEVEPLLKSTISSVTRRVIEDLKPEAEAMVQVAVEKEIATKRGELPEQVMPYVEEAVSDKLRLAERHIGPALEPALDETLQNLTQIGRERLQAQLMELAEEEIRQHFTQHRQALADGISGLVDELAAEELRTHVGRRMLEIADEVRISDRKLQRSYKWIAGLVLALLLMGLSLWGVISSTQERLMESQERLQRLEERLDPPHRPAVIR